jgi:hypothetical protein
MSFKHLACAPETAAYNYINFRHVYIIRYGNVLDVLFLMHDHGALLILLI